MNKREAARLALRAKLERGLTWEAIAGAVGRTPVGAALLVYGYAAATREEADALVRLLGLPEEAAAAFRRVPFRVPRQPWPPTDPFVSRMYEIVLLYAPAIKDVAHEWFGDGIISAVDMTLELQKERQDGADWASLTWRGKWLPFRRF
ncbi:cyanase [Hydrogenibacillus sp. N12]|uniref:cyanase n=1 Tax=Hydrogenibacillus sp. N12 TaxID=2866627 RepID=UPI001C7D69F8|nr:cyanase [Hydrogenibacillus sp. N12]QZA32330.1 cyanase [Hydrogenibacillus sp. N12]